MLEEAVPVLHAGGENRTPDALAAHVAAAEEGLKTLKDEHMVPMLVHLEDWHQLPAVRCACVAVDRDGETTLSIDEADDPSRVER